MPRELKFRAVFSEADNLGIRVVSTISFTVEELASWDEHEWQFRNGWTLPANDVEDGDLEYIQYTGLKDKNGVEIYEGDIVSTGPGPYRTFAVTISSFHGYCFMWGRDQINKSVGIDGAVIGNIWENPELLEE